MSDFYRRPERKPTRKAHRCSYCRQEIPKGAQHVEQTGVLDGKGIRNRFHPECFDALRKGCVVA